MTEMQTATTAEHAWLKQLTGEWSFFNDADKPEDRVEGIETVRMLGELWLVAEAESRLADGAPWRSLMTVGFDPAAGRFRGGWIGSMMAYHWVYDGALSPDGRTLHLESEGPAMDGSEAMQRYRDSIELIGDDERVQRSAVQGDDGQWTDFNITRYRRKGSAA